MAAKRRVTAEDKNSTRKKKAENEQFRRRRTNLEGKGDDLYKLCGAKVYIRVEKGARSWEYISHENWPPGRDSMVGAPMRMCRHKD